MEKPGVNPDSAGLGERRWGYREGQVSHHHLIMVDPPKGRNRGQPMESADPFGDERAAHGGRSIASEERSSGQGRTNQSFM